MIEKTEGSEDQRQRAAEAALQEIRPGMRLGLGSGRTAEAFVRFLGAKVRAGLDVIGVPTSARTAALATAEGIPITTLDETPALDLDVDGADEIGPGLALIKGGGGALLREKIVASAAARMLVVAEEAKLVSTLGAFPLPIEVVPFGLAATRRAIERAVSAIGLSGEFVLRQRDLNVANAEKEKLAHGGPFVTDGGHYILDASFGRIPDPVALARSLDAVTGVVEHGLFIGIASAAIVARSGGRVERILP